MYLICGGINLKHIKVVILIILITLFSGCSLNTAEYIHIKKKPSLDYYCNEIYNKLLENQDYSLEIFDTNVYKTISLDDNEKIIIKDFFSSLSNNSYKKYKDIKKLEPYEIRIIFKDSKYIIKIFDNETISVFPWDGVYEEDIVNMSSVPIRYNLYDYCNYIKNRSDLMG